MLDEIYQCLQKLLGLHRQLLDSVRLEKEALVNADLKGLQEATYSKEALIEGIRQVEARRSDLLVRLALEWKRPVKELSLSQMAIIIQGRDLKLAEQFRSVQNALAILIDRIREQNQYNQQLVNKSLEHVNQMKRNVLGESVPRSSTYNPRGERASGAPQGSRLISKEA